MYYLLTLIFKKKNKIALKTLPIKKRVTLMRNSGNFFLLEPHVFRQHGEET